MKKTGGKFWENALGQVRPGFVHLAAFLLPVLGLGLAFAAVGIYPFGDKSSLVFDLRSQYVTFLAYLRDEIWLGNADFLYTFAKALGGDMAGFAAYYLLSPFNLVLLAFSKEMLPLGITLMTLLKVGFCGFAMSLLLNRGKAGFETLLFSVSYALMDFVIAFHFNIMWLDGVILLPVIILGLERLLCGKSPLCYVLSLGGAIFINYYIGFMLCLFSLLYFVVQVLFIRPAQAGGRPWPAPRQVLRNGLRFGGASLLAGGLSAVVLLPALFSLQGGKAGFSAEAFMDKSFASSADVISRYIPGTSTPQQVFFGYPAIYTGMFVLVCAILYFCNRKIPGKMRLGNGFLVAALMLSFVVGPMDRVWHGLNKPVGFLFRYSFLLGFLLVYLGWQGFTKLRYKTVSRYLPGIFAGIVIILLIARQESHQHITLGKLALGAGFAGAALLAVYFYLKKKKRVFVFIMLGIVALDMGANMFLSLRRTDYYSMEKYQTHVREEQAGVDAVKSRDNGFYRMEKAYSFTDNDAFLFGYNGLSHFSSADKLFVREFLDGMGLSDGGYGVKYADGTTVAMESLLGMKYLVTGTEGTVKPYTLLETVEEKQVWQNPYALPLGFLAGAGVADEMPWGPNVFEQYNMMWQAIAPESPTAIYRQAPAEMVMEGVAQRVVDGEYLFDKTAEGGYVEYLIRVESNDMLYVLFTTQQERNVDIYINGQNHGRFLYNDRHGAYPIGSFAPGETVSVRLVPQGWELFLQEAVFAYEDGQALEALTAQLQSSGYQITKHTSSRIEGTVDNAAGKPTLLLSIPYDEGWHARVDGQTAALRPAFGALTALELPAGSHQVELWYIPPGLWAGLACTVLCAGLLVLWLLFEKGALLRRKLPGKAAPETEKPPEAEAGGEPTESDE